MIGIQPGQPGYRVCTRCVMDSTDPAIAFDAEGVCNHCRAAEASLAKIRLSPDESKRRLDAAAARIKEAGKGREYDAVAGLSGGVDSSYVAWLAHQLGLRVLIVHFDNGWNAEIAVRNIENVVVACDYDLETMVIDWDEFRDLQRAFLKAGVLDIEMLSDHAIMASMFGIAAKFDIPVVLSGTNVATEHGMPRAWVWNKQDLTNILGIHKRFGEIALATYPRMGMWQSLMVRQMGRGPEFVELLDMANFRKTDAMDILARETGWQYYGGKHYESVFTKFYQAHILPTKFGIDKRKVHLSALIRSGEITRDAAVAELAKPLYDERALIEDRAFVTKKLGFTEAEFAAILAAEPVPHDHYSSDKRLRDMLRFIRDFGRPGRS